jgi:hypothetical protein
MSISEGRLLGGFSMSGALVATGYVADFTELEG